MPFKKGQSGNPAGMARGYKHELTKEVRGLAGRLFDGPYWRLKYERIHAGIENPKIEALLLAYAFGEPPKEIHASGTVIHLGPLQALRERPAIDVQVSAENSESGESANQTEDDKPRVSLVVDDENP
jgi:hypothetical protein